MKTLNWFISVCFISSTLALNPHASAGGSNDTFDKYISCNRNSEVRALQQKIISKEGCDAHTVIQGIAYKCGRPEGEANVRMGFYETLIEHGKARCKEFCSDISSKCRGVFTPPSSCFYPKTDDIEGMGKDMGCSPSCEGTAFIYCSFYQASYLRYDENLFKDKSPNCYCEPSTSPTPTKSNP